MEYHEVWLGVVMAFHGAHVFIFKENRFRLYVVNVSVGRKGLI
jgi:hypothetical protein